MGEDVDVAELARITKNFSGAEIGGLIKSATSFAMNRHIKVGTVAGISNDLDTMQVGRQDFMNALEEVHAAFGVSEAELQQVVQNGIIHFDPRVDVSVFFVIIACLLGLILTLPSFPYPGHPPRRQPLR
jgi:vesicle-fusing ATPase